MPELTVSKIIASEENIPVAVVMEKLIAALKSEFNKVKISNKNADPEISCRVKTKLFNPIVSIKAPVKIQSKEKKIKILIDGAIKTNGWFWFTALIGIPFPLLWVMMIFMYSAQKKSSAKSMDNVLQKIEYDLSDF
jgi:hypothetical protein